MTNRQTDRQIESTTKSDKTPSLGAEINKHSAVQQQQQQQQQQQLITNADQWRHHLLQNIHITIVQDVPNCFVIYNKKL